MVVDGVLLCLLRFLLVVSGVRCDAEEERERTGASMHLRNWVSRAAQPSALYPCEAQQSGTVSFSSWLSCKRPKACDCDQVEARTQH